MEREGKGEGMKKRGRRRGEGEMMRGIIVGGMVIGLLMGCNNGIAELEKRNSFYESVVKIGQGFQEVFGIFGKAMGDALGFSVLTSGDKISKIGDHFNKVKEGLTTTKNSLNELSSKISEAKNTDRSTIKVVEDAIKGASEVFDKLIGALAKLASVTNDSGTDIGDTANATTTAAAPKASVDPIILEVKNIIAAAEKSGIEIKPGTPGGEVTHTNGTKALTYNNDPTAGLGSKLADEVSKADAWAMVDKIKDANTTESGTLSATSYGAGELATGAATTNAANAKTIADLAAAVALKAMTKEGKPSATANEVVAVKAAGVSAVNKVLGVLDEIIRKTVEKNLEKVREAVKGISYSETTSGEATEVKK